MGIIASLMSVSAAMVVHGIVQSVSNGSRSVILRKHIRWDILVWQLLGALPAIGIMIWFCFGYPKAYWREMPKNHLMQPYVGRW